MQTSTPTFYEEAELVFFLKQKDERVFSYLYDNYSKGLYLVICKIVGDQHHAEDVLQEVFVKVWSRIDQYDPAKGRIYTWMINVARNAAVDAMRSKASMMKQRTSQAETENTHNIPVLPAQTDAIGLKVLISKLRPQYQQLLEMAYYNGYTMAEISKILVMPEGTVKTHLRKAISALKADFSFHQRVKVALAQVA